MSYKDKINRTIKLIVEKLFKAEVSERKINSVNVSFTIMFHMNNKTKFIQNIMCITPHPTSSRLQKLKVIVDKYNIEQITKDNITIVELEQLNSKKIKKEYSTAIVNFEKLNKSIKSCLTKKSILDSKITQTAEYVSYYEKLKQQLCTKIIQTNNTLSCKVGDYTLGQKIILENLYSIAETITKRNMIIHTINLMVHGEKPITMKIA